MIKVIQIYEYFAKESFIMEPVNITHFIVLFWFCVVFVNESEINKNPLWNRFFF